MSSWRRAFEILAAKHCEPRWYDNVHFSLMWCVKMHGCADFETVWKRMCHEHYINEAEAITRIPDKRAVEAWYEENVEELESITLESMRETFMSDDTMKFVTPEREARWGVKAPKDGWGCEYGFYGRSGGWLGLIRFDGYEMTGDDPDILDRNTPNKTIRALCCMIEEITHTVDQREDEFVYQMAFHMRYHSPFVPE